MRKRKLYILAFFKALRTYIWKRCTWERQRQTAKGLSIGLVIIMMLVSMGGQSVRIDMEETPHTAKSIGHNQVNVGNHSARIEMLNSRVSKEYENGEKRNQVISDTAFSSDTEKTANAVIKNPIPLSLVEKTYADYGQNVEREEVLYRYQFPVEIGHEKDSNYDGKQSAGDYIFSRLYHTDDIEKNIESELEKERKSEENKEKDLQHIETSEEEVIDEELDFLKDVWSRIMPTEPSEVHVTQKPKQENSAEQLLEQAGKTNTEQATDFYAGTEVKTGVLETVADTQSAVENEEAENTETGENTVEAETAERTAEENVEMTEDTEAPETAEIIGIGETTEISDYADGSYFIVNGSVRAESGVFVSDIVIKPTNVKGFDQIRIGENGEFSSSAIIAEDAVDKTVDLYFSDGSTVTNAVQYTYSRDTVTPTLAFPEQDIHKLQTVDYTIYCTNHADIRMETKDDANGYAGTGVIKYNYLYGNIFKCLFDDADDVGLELPESFYGRVLVNCADLAGNISKIVSSHYLIENQKPQVQFLNGDMCTAPYTLWIDVADKGEIVSGIENVVCRVNGENYDLQDIRTLENTVLGTDLEVPTQMTFPVSLEEEGTYTIEVEVKDYAGNETVQTQTLEVKKPEMVAVLMPTEFTIHIDPQQLAGREQIFSDDIELHNISDFDVEVTMQEITVNVQNSISESGIRKDCDLYLIAPDTGERLALKKGKNKNVYSFRLQKGQDSVVLHFVGDTTKGADEMWRDSDISIDVQLSFAKSDEDKGD